MARGSFVWTDSEVELLLNVALDYKPSKAQDNVDWDLRALIRLCSSI